MKRTKKNVLKTKNQPKKQAKLYTPSGKLVNLENLELPEFITSILVNKESK